MITSSDADYAAPLSVLEIDLDAVARNWLFLKKTLKAGTDCAAVVKADGYGLGAAPVSKALYSQGCRHFFVAHLGEGIALRAALESDALIYILNGPWGGSASDFIAARLIPVLNSRVDIAYWQRNASGAACILHVDTGMNRLGLGVEEVEALDLSSLKKMDIRYIMSHLACADEPVHAMNARQLSLFNRLSTVLKAPFRYSLANSAGILLGPDYHFDLVRPGCALYGINPSSGSDPMAGVVRLRARVLQIREIKKTGAVGYGATYPVSPPVKCATLSVGYADGYLRHFTGSGKVFIGKTQVPVIGRVSMDTIIVDVTGLEDVNAGDWANIIGPQQTVDDIARDAGTIGYEILTSLGRRYHRVYKGA